MQHLMGTFLADSIGGFDVSILTTFLLCSVAFGAAPGSFGVLFLFIRQLGLRDKDGFPEQGGI